MRLIKEVYETTNLIVEEKLGKKKEYFIEGTSRVSSSRVVSRTVTVVSIHNKRWIKKYNVTWNNMWQRTVPTAN